MDSEHISDLIEDHLKNSGWTFRKGGADRADAPGYYKKSLKTATPGEISDGTRDAMLALSQDGRWFYRLDGWGAIQKELDLRRYNNNYSKAISDVLTESKYMNINEAFSGVRINANDAKKISAIVKPATRSGSLTGFAESLYSQWEDEFTNTNEILNRLNESSNDEMKDWGLNRAEYQRVVKEVLSIGLKEFNESQVNESKAFKDYDAAFKEASKLAKQVDKDYGLEFNKSTKEYVIFMLPKEQNRTGHELTCQVVTKNESRVDEAGFEVGANLEKLRKEYVQKFYAGTNLVTVIRSKNGQTVVYTYEVNGTYCAVIYTRSVRKPTAFKTAKTQTALQLILKEFIINNDKINPLDPPKSAAHGVQVGQIFHISWGYSMILNNFYQVVSLPSAQMAVVQELNKDTTGSHPGMRQTPNMTPTGQPFRVKLNVKTDKVYIKTPYGYASAWDGKPQYFDNYD